MFGDFETRLSEAGGWNIMHIRIYQGLYVTKTENNYKRKVFEKVFKDDIKFNIKEVIFSTDKNVTINLFVLEATKGEEKIEIRSHQRLPLEYICYHV